MTDRFHRTILLLMLSIQGVTAEAATEIDCWALERLQQEQGPPPLLAKAESPEINTPHDPDRRLRILEYLNFQAISKTIWSEMQETFPKDLEVFRSWSRVQQREYKRAVVEDIEELLRSQTASGEFGMHMNLHGGKAIDYVESGGIYSTYSNALIQSALFAGSVGSSPPESPTPYNPTVFFFHSRDRRILGRFQTKSPFVDQLMSEGPSSAASGGGDRVAIFFDIDKAREDARRNLSVLWSKSALYYPKSFVGRVSVPFSAFLLPPAPIAHNVQQELQLSEQLAQNEQMLGGFLHLKLLIHRFLECGRVCGERR